MKRLLRYLLLLWRRFWRRDRLKHVVHLDSRSELPKRLGDSIYIVGGESPKWAVLACPCRCGEQIDVNLMTSRRPNWQLTMRNDSVTLRPSLWVPEDKCGSHFWITDNAIKWV